MPSSRIRVCNLVPELEKTGLQCDVQPYPRRWWQKIRLAFRTTGYDITYLQKKLPSRVESFILKRSARKLLFDFDDAVYARHESCGPVKCRSRERKTQSVLSRADAVIVGNRILKRYADAFCRHVHIVPSCAEVRSIPVNTHKKAAGPIVIGWIGGKINLPHLQLLSSVFQNLAQTHDIEVHVVCDSTLEIPGVRVRHIPWMLERQEADVAAFDIGVMPLPPTRHAEGKCGYKAIQCMAASVPVVVSDVGINRELVEHGVDGFVTPLLTDFQTFLGQLIDSPSLRAEMGANARRKVEQLYSIETGGRQLAQLLHAL